MDSNAKHLSNTNNRPRCKTIVQRTPSCFLPPLQLCLHLLPVKNHRLFVPLLRHRMFRYTVYSVVHLVWHIFLKTRRKNVQQTVGASMTLRRSYTDVVSGNRNFHTLLISTARNDLILELGRGRVSVHHITKTLHSFLPCPTAAMIVCGLAVRNGRTSSRSFSSSILAILTTCYCDYCMAGWACGKY